MYDIGIGDLGLKRWEFEHEITFGELLCRYAGQLRKREDDYNKTRHLMWAALRPHTKRSIKPEDLIKLRTDRRYFELIDEDEYKNLINGKATDN
jgi:hypothetical protein